MQMTTDDSWHLVRDTPKVTGFLGPASSPTPISEAEALRIVQQVTEGADKPRRPPCNTRWASKSRVADGPFTSFMGTVEEVDEEEPGPRLRQHFGRSTPVDLEYGQVEKV